MKINKKIWKGHTCHVGSCDIKIKCHKALWLQNQCHRFMTWTYKRHITWFKAHGFWHTFFRHASVTNADVWHKFHILWLKLIVTNRHISCSGYWALNPSKKSYWANDQWSNCFTVSDDVVAIPHLVNLGHRSHIKLLMPLRQDAAWHKGYTSTSTMFKLTRFSLHSELPNASHTYVL
jgi:hypothetical protein